MSITLFALNSSFTHTNLAVRYLASVLSSAGMSVNIKEYTLKDKKSRVLYELVSTGSKIFAFSVYIWNRNEMLGYARELKKLCPDCCIILGGPEVSYEDESFLKAHPYIDTLIRGEGESVIADVCLHPKKNRIVDGVPTNGFTAMGILYDRYPAEGDILYYESSRGCPYRCSYCLSALSQSVRSKSVEATLKDLKEFERLESKPRIIKLVDRTFNYDIDRAKQIWRGLCSEEYTLNYHFEIAADLLDEESFEILRNMPAGKIQLEAGIQSTNPCTLKAIKRKNDSNRIIENLARIKSYDNIHVHADLIAGLPYEDMNSFKRSFDNCLKCCHKLQVGFLKMLKGSTIRAEAQSHGYVYDSDTPYKVLCNNYISYRELYRLERIAATIDRFYSSDKFANTMEYILAHTDSPFEFFSQLTDLQTKDLDKTSQHECRLLLIEAIGNDEDALGRLALDTLINENKNPPKELQGCYTEYLKDIITPVGENFKGCNANKLHIYSFNFDKDNYYIIDRTNHITEKRCIK
ncbi:MAG: B12-binding domain-containing radical SAM protein [Clostridia bacterium]|nr:B12-binding domain-containing radical SAM protein [Clostridia bacterium]